MAPLHVWQQLKKNTVQHQRVSTVLQHQLGIKQILDTHAQETFLPSEVANKLKELVCLFLKEYSTLANAADKDKKLLFSVAPKFHWLWHLGARAVFLNPHKGCTMLDEDYMGSAMI